MVDVSRTTIERLRPINVTTQYDDEFSAFPYISQQRLDYFIDMLVASGWERGRTDNHWLAPKTFRKLLDVNVGRGHVSLSTAVAAQVRYDQFVASQGHG